MMLDLLKVVSFVMFLLMLWLVCTVILFELFVARCYFAEVGCGANESLYVMIIIITGGFSSAFLGWTTVWALGRVRRQISAASRS
jgi:hypothetical protein